MQLLKAHLHLKDDQPRNGIMNTRANISLSNIRMMILCQYPLSTEEYGHCYYDGDEGVTKDPEEAYVWYRVAQCAGNNNVNSLVNYIGSTLSKSKCLRLSSRANHPSSEALQC